jgi:hypothetical protein
MRNKSLSRRSFVKQASIGTAGAALAADGLASGIYIQDADKPAILGGTPVRPRGTDLEASWPVFDDSDVQMYVDAFKSKRWSEYSNSPRELSGKFEKAFADMMGVGYCAVTSSGTNALDASQRAFEIGPGDEVITQTNTFIATAQTTFNLFALPVFVDSDPETL